MAAAVRSVDDLRAADIAVGQRWYHVTTQSTDRRTYEVVARTGEHDDFLRMRAVDLDEELEVHVGRLLCAWVLVAEA